MSQFDPYIAMLAQSLIPQQGPQTATDVPAVTAGPGDQLASRQQPGIAAPQYRQQFERMTAPDLNARPAYLQTMRGKGNEGPVGDALRSAIPKAQTREAQSLVRGGGDMVRTTQGYGPSSDYVSVSDGGKPTEESIISGDTGKPITQEEAARQAIPIKEGEHVTVGLGIPGTPGYSEYRAGPHGEMSGGINDALTHLGLTADESQTLSRLPIEHAIPLALRIGQMKDQAEFRRQQIEDARMGMVTKQMDALANNAMFSTSKDLQKQYGDLNKQFNDLVGGPSSKESPVPSHMRPGDAGQTQLPANSQQPQNAGIPAANELGLYQNVPPVIGNNLQNVAQPTKAAAATAMLGMGQQPEPPQYQGPNAHKVGDVVTAPDGKKYKITGVDKQGHTQAVPVE